MKYIQRTISMTLALCLGCLVLLAGCSGSEAQSATSAAASSAASATSAGEADAPEAEETIVGQVSYVGSEYISVSVCTGAEDTQDWAALDTATLTVSEETASIDTDDATEYLAVRSGLTEAAAREDVTVGAFIAAHTTDDGTLQIILLAATAQSDAEAESEQAADAGADSATSQDSEEQESAQSGAAAASGEQDGGERPQEDL